MKAYGHSRRDKTQCKYGCCGFKSIKQRNCRKINDRSNRKTARQLARIETIQQIYDRIEEHHYRTERISKQNKRWVEYTYDRKDNLIQMLTSEGYKVFQAYDNNDKLIYQECDDNMYVTVSLQHFNVSKK